MQITYEQVGDYLLPNIAVPAVPAEERNKPLGRYARMHRDYLREHRPILYSSLLCSGKLFPLLRELDEAAERRVSEIGNREIAHVIILSELVYN